MADIDGEKVFIIGLTMAGAVSAGAYTAGVLDVLFRALDFHNARYQAGKVNHWSGEFENHPRHRVVIKAMSGTSAGGACIGNGIADLIAQFQSNVAGNAPEDRYRRLREPERVSGGRHSCTSYDPGPPREGKQPYSYDFVMGKLHELWVESIDMMHSETEGLLSTRDLADEKRPVRSLLNSEHLDTEALSALKGVGWSDGPGAEGRSRYSFLFDDLDLFITTTNLMGVPFAVPFVDGQGGAAAHRMAQHSTVRHFRALGLGDGKKFPSPWLEEWKDDGIPLDPNAAIDFGKSADFEDEGGWALLRHASIASGAFPGGLAARMLHTEAQDYGIRGPNSNSRARGGAMPVEEWPDINSPQWPGAFAGGIMNAGFKEAVRYVAVDGGAANNEPFEYARFAIRSLITDSLANREADDSAADKPRGNPPEHGRTREFRYLAPNPREPSKADRAVIMIDPFPEGPDYVSTAQPPDAAARGREVGLVRTLLRLPGALLNQARFKPSELFLAMKGDVRSRFLIAPSRLDADGKTRIVGAAAIASGALGGFFGFAHRNFRAHDFMLGQSNCASFLARHFELDPENVVLGLPPDRVKAIRAQLNAGKSSGTQTPSAGRGVAIIDPGDRLWPTPDSAGRATFPQPVWPQLDLERLSALRRQLGKRLERLGGFLLRQQRFFGKILGWLFGIIWKCIDSAAGEKLAPLILPSLLLREQICGFASATPNDPSRDLRRRVFATLAASGSKPMSIADIVESLKPPAVSQAEPIGADAVAKLLDDAKKETRPLVWEGTPRGEGPASRVFTLSIFRPGALGRLSDWVYGKYATVFGSGAR